MSELNFDPSMHACFVSFLHYKKCVLYQLADVRDDLVAKTCMIVGMNIKWRKLP